MTDGVQGAWTTVEQKHTRTYLFELSRKQIIEKEIVFSLSKKMSSV